MKTNLLLDCNYLCHRAKHAFRDLSYKGNPTSVIYGFLKEITTLTHQFQPTNIAFAFDSDRSKSLRLKMFAGYKKKRHDPDKVYTDEEQQEFKDFHAQVRIIQKILGKIGFPNMGIIDGYEADDVLAAYRLANPKRNAVIVTADKDMFQLIDAKTTVWNPHTKVMMTEELFSSTFNGIRASQWAKVKAIAGCSTDDIPGLKGVAEKTASLYLAKKMKTGGQGHQSISKFLKTEEYKRNLQLVTLPFTPLDVTWKRTYHIDPQKWADCLRMFGIRHERISPPLIIPS